MALVYDNNNNGLIHQDDHDQHNHRGDDARLISQKSEHSDTGLEYQRGGVRSQLD